MNFMLKMLCSAIEIIMLSGNVNGYMNKQNTLLWRKKCNANQKQHCKQIGVTKNFDISRGQEVTLSKILLTP